MTYKQFKRELYMQVLLRENAGHKRIKLLEKCSVCADTDTVRLVKIRNSIIYGRSEFFIREDMLCIVWGESDLIHMLYWKLEELYRRFCREGWQSVLPEIYFKMRRCEQQDDPKGPEKKDGGRTGDRLMIRPQNYHYFQEDLRDSVYWRFGDIALVLHTILYEGDEDYITMRCGRDLVRQRGISGEIAMVNALLQTCVRFPSRIYRSGDIQRYFGGRGGEPAAVCREDTEEAIKGYRLTNSRGLDGAVVLFYPGVKEQLAEMLGGDYYVGFINNREVVVHPVQYKALADMKAAIQRVNAMSDRREVLTNRVYRYCSLRKKLIEM